MKIYGDESSSLFQTYRQEPGLIWGSNDVLEGGSITYYNLGFSLFRDPLEPIITQNKLYLHVFSSPWSSFTGYLREYFMPWKWEVAYLDRENNTPPERILVYKEVPDSVLSDRLKAVIGRSIFEVNPIQADQYLEVFGQEFLRIKHQDTLGANHRIFVIHHPLGSCAGEHQEWTQDDLCHIYRIRGLFSYIAYYFLKIHSPHWEEVTLRAGQLSERVLIKRTERSTISGANLIV